MNSLPGFTRRKHVNAANRLQRRKLILEEEWFIFVLAGNLNAESLSH